MKMKMTHKQAIKGLRAIADWHFGKYEQTREEGYEIDAEFLRDVADMLEAEREESRQ